MKLIIDFDRLDGKTLEGCLKRFFGLEGDLEDMLKELSKSFDLHVTEIPLPKSNLLKVSKGFRVNLNKECDDETLSKLLKFCKPVESFTIDEVWECNGVRFILSKDFEEIYVLETNVDDVSGEFISYATNEILKYALDVYVYPYFGKKGRPGYMVKVLCRDNPRNLAKIVCEVLPTLGVRIHRVGRYKVEREVVERTVKVFGKEFKLRVKVSEVSLKPEFEDVKRIAESLKRPLPMVYIEVLRGLNDEDTERE